MKNQSIPVVIVIFLCLIFFTAKVDAQSAAPVISVDYGVTIINNSNVNFDIQISSENVSGNFQVTVIASKGAFTVTSTGRLSSITGNGTKSVTMTGSYYNINSALYSMTYFPDSGFSGTDMISVLATDLSSSQVGSIQVPVQISDVPVVKVPGTKSVLNNSDLAISGISISYPSIASESLPVTLSVSHGIVTLPESSGLAYIKGNGTEKVTVLGSLDNINTALAGLKYHSAPQYTGTDILTISANDMGDLGSYSMSAVVNTVAINVLDRPCVMVPAQQIQWMPDNSIDGAYLTISGTCVKDDTIGINNIQLSLATGNGTVTLGTWSNMVSISGNGTGSITITGNLSDVNSVLSFLTYRFTANYSGSDTITITAMDTGTSASSSGSININKISVNDILIVTAPQGLSTPNNTGYKIQGFFITYLNPVNSNMEAVISASHGTLSLSSVSGLEYIGGNGTASITLAGSLANINSALVSLTYAASPGYTGTESIILEMTDLNTYKTASATAMLNVTANGSSGAPDTGAAPGSSNESTVQRNGNSINIKPVLDSGNSTAKARLAMDDITRAVSSAQQDSSGNWYINITIDPISGVNIYELSLPSDLLSDPAAMLRIKINIPLCTVSIPSNLFYGTDTAGKDAVISVSGVNSSGFPAGLKAAIGNRPVIELQATLGGQKAVWKNNSTPVSVSIPYRPSGNEAANPEHIAVWCLDGSGNITPVPNCSYDASAGAVNFTVTHFSKYALSFVNKTFADLSGYTWAKKQIEIMASKGIINGTSSSTFSPAANITRGDFVKLLITSLGLTADITDNFSDVKKTVYYYDMVGIARKLGIISDSADGKFNPGAYITRQDMMVMTAKALMIAKPATQPGSFSDLSAFSDRNKLPPTVRDYAATLIKNGIISGSVGKLNPAQFTSRAEAAVILYRLLRLV